MSEQEAAAEGEAAGRGGGGSPGGMQAKNKNPTQ